MERDVYLQLRERYTRTHELGLEVLLEYYKIFNKKEEYNIETISQFAKVFNTCYKKFGAKQIELQMRLGEMAARVIERLDTHFNIVFLSQGREILKIY